MVQCRLALVVLKMLNLMVAVAVAVLGREAVLSLVTEVAGSSVHAGSLAVVVAAAVLVVGTVVDVLVGCCRRRGRSFGPA